MSATTLFSARISSNRFRLRSLFSSIRNNFSGRLRILSFNGSFAPSILLAIFGFN